MTYEQAQAQLVAMARRNGGSIAAGDVEADPALAADRDTDFRTLPSRNCRR